MQMFKKETQRTMGMKQQTELETVKEKQTKQPKIQGENTKALKPTNCFF